MLSRLSIRDIVLIDRLDIDFADELAVLTGETGAGKSILLDAFALALGGRGDQSLVRQGAEQGQVTAAFEVARDHPARRDPDDVLIGIHALAVSNRIPGRREQAAHYATELRRIERRPPGCRSGDQSAGRHEARAEAQEALTADAAGAAGTRRCG